MIHRGLATAFQHMVQVMRRLLRAGVVGVLPEHCQGRRHLGDLVMAILLDCDVEVAGGDFRHRTAQDRQTAHHYAADIEHRDQHCD